MFAFYFGDENPRPERAGGEPPPLRGPLRFDGLEWDVRSLLLTLGAASGAPTKKKQRQRQMQKRRQWPRLRKFQISDLRFEIGNGDGESKFKNSTRKNGAWGTQKDKTKDKNQMQMQIPHP